MATHQYLQGLECLESECDGIEANAMADGESCVENQEYWPLQTLLNLEGKCQGAVAHETNGRKSDFALENGCGLPVLLNMARKHVGTSPACSSVFQDCYSLANEGPVHSIYHLETAGARASALAARSQKGCPTLAMSHYGYSFYKVAR